MPRYITKPIIVEAHVFTGSIALWPESFRLAVRRHLPGGITEIETGDGVRQMRSGDWVTRGPDGAFTVYRPSPFETYFVKHDPEPAPDPDASVKRAIAKGTK